MDAVRYLLLFVELITAILLVGIILLQKSKGQGMGMAFGAGVGEALFGAQAGNVLTKTTVVLAVIFLLNTTILSMLGARYRPAASRSIADLIPTKPAATQPAAPSGGQQAEFPSGGMPAGHPQAPVAPMASAQSSVDQPSMPLPAAPVAPVKVDVPPAAPAAPVAPAPEKK